uniref:Transmembrane protein n=1 Tax=Fagus sylvatica TaxID=28930 RepID=A0A2N9FRR5_FAGSY
MARLVEGWLGLVGVVVVNGVVVIRWLGVVDSVGLGLCAGGFGSLPRSRVVESVAWSGCWVCAAKIGLGWCVCTGFGSLPRLTTGGFGSLRWWVWVFVGFVVVDS